MANNGLTWAAGWPDAVRVHRPFRRIVIAERGAQHAATLLSGYLPGQDAFVIRQREGESYAGFSERVSETLAGVSGVSDVEYLRAPVESPEARRARARVVDLLLRCAADTPACATRTGATGAEATA